MAEPAHTRPSDHDFISLVVRYLDGQVSPEELSELNAQLAADDSKRELFVDICLQGRLLAESLGNHLTTSSLPPGESQGEGTEPRKSPLLGFLADSFQQGTELLHNPTRFSILIAAMAIGSLLTLLAFWAAPLYRNNSRWREPAVAPRYVARLTRTIDCRWADHQRPSLSQGEGRGEGPPRLGQYLDVDQQVDLLEGLVEITFSSGARVILEGPATFQPQSENAGRLNVGRLTAKVVEQARGFTIHTPTIRVVDLGTEFGVRVRQDTAAEVHVFAGRVALEAESHDLSERQLSAGQAVRIDASGRAERIDVDVQGFVRVDQLPPPGMTKDAARRLAGVGRVETVSLDAVGDKRIFLFNPDKSDTTAVLSACTKTVEENIQRSAIRFDLGGLPAGYSVGSATLTLTSTASNKYTNSSGLATEVYRLTQSWVEGQVTATDRDWGPNGVNESPGDDRPWNTLGGDYVGTSGLPDVNPYASSNATGAGDVPIAWDVTQLVSEWYTAASPNHGLLLRSRDGNHLHFRSREHGGGNGPLLSIELVPKPVPRDIDSEQTGRRTTNKQISKQANSLGP